MKNSNRTLAHTLKIAHITMQRKYLENVFSKKTSLPSPDGNPAFCYTGYIFPENIAWLKDNDFDVFITRSLDSNSEEYGLETYVITPSNLITLSDEEMVESTTQFENLIADVENNAEGFMDFLKSLGANIDDDYEDNDED